MKSHEIMIEAVTPAVGVPGGEVSITCRGFKPGLPASAKVLFGKVEASIISASAERVVIRLPENSQALGIELQVDGKVSPMFPFILGARLAAELHPVTNPVIAPDGAIITTVSGTRGPADPALPDPGLQDGPSHSLSMRDLESDRIGFQPRRPTVHHQPCRRIRPPLHEL